MLATLVPGYQAQHQLCSASVNGSILSVKATQSHVAVLVTTPDIETARALAQAALEARLVACANLIPNLESHYWWQGKLESSSEVLMIFKSRRSKLRALETLILSKHPYDTPEFVVLPIAGGSDRYLAWITNSVIQPKSTPRKQIQ